MKEKLKPSDLRIGNWYMSVKFNKPVQCDLSDLFDLCAHADGAIDDPPIERMFSPIPLSPEWLQRAGFVKKTDLDGDEYYDKDFLALEYMEFATKEDNGFYYRWNNPNETRILYVHQLQNLYYALTQTELTFNQP